MFVMLIGCETVLRGGVPERSNGAVLKTVEPHGSVSSNLTPAASPRGCSVALAAMTTGEDLRGLMRLWPHGVSILSVDVEGDRMGVTVSSLVSLSLEPPLVGVSIGKDASCYELLRSAGRFAVSLLGAEQEELARRFAAGYPPIVHWQGVPTREGQVAPLIEGALGWIEARTLTEADAGDHTFFIADVLSIEHGPSHHALVYRESNYHSV